MKNLKWIFLTGFVGVLVYMFFSQPSFEQKTQKEFEAYSVGMVQMENSPVKVKAGIRFFEPNSKAIVQASFEPSNKKDSIQMTNSKKEIVDFAGEIVFTVNKHLYRCKVFDEGEQLMLAFFDKSNGMDTYPGGRYINILKEDIEGNKFELDFNKSRNFYCAYSKDFICPIPPKENRILDVVAAGEKMYVSN
ncbi:MAG: DUF1684 domain-containing protein [Leadbetterella sp.]